jgi:cyclophilin family peptidyl-prolyl cis-trans isomerase
MKTIGMAGLGALLLSTSALAQEAEAVTPASIVEAAAPEEWVAIAPEDLLVMDLAPDAAGRARQVVIQFIPAPFSQPWVENVRKLARAHWWDGTSVYRVVDNWVAQWGDVSEEKPLPEGVVSPVADYVTKSTHGSEGSIVLWHPRGYFEDAYTIDPEASAGWTRIADGWPIAEAVSDDTRTLSQWPIHCYGHVGVARDLAPDTGTGAELYAVIGHAPRQLDRNIAVIGRVISGIEYLSTLPRGMGEAGVYEDRAEDVPIISVRMGDELPEQLHFEYLSTESESFARYVASRANRSDAFYTVPAGGVDVCNVQVPIRAAAL